MEAFFFTLFNYIQTDSGDSLAPPRPVGIENYFLAKTSGPAVLYLVRG